MHALTRPRLLHRRAFVGAGLACLAAPALGAGEPAGEMSGILDPSQRLATLYEGGRWCEGPVWVPRLGGLVFSDVRADRMWLLVSGKAPAILRDPSSNANGNALDREGRLITCEHRTGRVVREEPDGRRTVLAERFEGGRLNAPNDAVVARDGAVWFTDPTYGIDKPEEGEPRAAEQRARFVFRLDPGGGLDAVEDGFAQPNGLAFSPDGRVLYVSETGGPAEIRAFDVIDGRRLGGGRVFAAIGEGVADGLKTDAAGRLYAACADGVRIWRPDGTPLGRIPTPAPCANLAFGGPDGRRLFLCATSRVHAIDLAVRGAGLPG